MCHTQNACELTSLLLYPLKVHQCCDEVDDQSSDFRHGSQPASEADSNNSADGQWPMANGEQSNKTTIPVSRQQSRRVAASNARAMIRVQAEDS